MTSSISTTVRRRRVGSALIVGAALFAVLAGTPVEAGPSYRIVDIELTSEHVAGPLKTRVRIPTAEPPPGGWPLVYLLHGHGEDHTAWTAGLGGDLNGTLPSFEAVFVMPDARDGWYTDHYDNLLADVSWTRYYVDELVPHIDATFPVSRDRRKRAIVGASMGGTGAAILASQRPDLFGSLVSLSGSLHHRHPLVVAGISALNALDGGYEGIFGPPDGDYAVAHDPTSLTVNLRATRTFAFTGDGSIDPAAAEIERFAPSEPLISKAFLLGAGTVVEAAILVQNEAFAAAARDDGVPLTYEVTPGSHDWPYFRRQLQRAVTLGLFNDAPPPTAWTFRTARPSGRAWAYTYRFDARPATLLTLSYGAGLLEGTGKGTVTIDGPGCSFTAELPFTRHCPAAA